MVRKGTILVVDDNKSVLTAVELLLGSYFEKSDYFGNSGENPGCSYRGESRCCFVGYEFFCGYQYRK